MGIFKKDAPRTTHLKRDLLLVVLSIFVAYYLAKSGAFGMLVGTHLSGFMGAVISGLFFTSAFTLAPATIVLVEISQTASPVYIALWGAFGAMLGDFIIFSFIRDSLADDLQELMKGRTYRRIASVFRLRIFRWLTPMIGALIISSPLPDELGLAMMGFSKMRTGLLLPVSFVMNFFGILAVCAVAGTL